MIDWTATGAMMSGWGALAGAAAVAYAAIKAANTVESWRVKKIAERRFDHAERVLVAAYKVRDAMRDIRGPMIWGIEQVEAQKELEADTDWETVPADKQPKFIMGQARIRRIRRTEDAWDELIGVAPLAKALFGDEVEGALRRLLHQRGITRVNIDALVDDDGSDREFSRQIRMELNRSDESDGEDKVSIAIREAITTIEANCLPILRTD